MCLVSSICILLCANKLHLSRLGQLGRIAQLANARAWLVSVCHIYQVSVYQWARCGGGGDTTLLRLSSIGAKV